MNIDRNAKVMIIGGHLTPALALVQELKANQINNLIWIGTKHSQTNSTNLSAEYLEVEKLGIPFYEFRTGKLWRKWTLRTIHLGIFQLLLIPWGFIKAFFILLRLKPVLVVGLGGYLQLPLIFWARILGIYSIIHEQTSVIGTANSYSGKFANRIFLSWPDTVHNFQKDKVMVVGNLLRKEFFENLGLSKSIFNNSKPLVLVTGGNQGANTINKRLFAFLPEILTKVNIIHQVGNSSVTNDLEIAKSTFANLPEELKNSYRFFASDFQNFNEYMKMANVIVSRSGANTVTEILALGKLVVLIPIPWSSQMEQQKNAEIVAKTGLGYILKQYDEMPPEELHNAINLALDKYLAKKDFLNRDIAVSTNEASQLVNPNATRLIVENVFRLN